MLACSVALLGCADDASRERDYVEGIRRAEANISRTIDRQFTGPVPADAPTLAARSQELVGSVTAVRSDIEKLEPPDHWRDDHQRILDAIGKVERGVSLRANALAAGDAARASAASIDVERAARQFDRSVAEIEDELR